MGSRCLVGTKFSLGGLKISGDRWVWWPLSPPRAPTAPERYTKNGYNDIFNTQMFYRNKNEIKTRKTGKILAMYLQKEKNNGNTVPFFF